MRFSRKPSRPESNFGVNAQGQANTNAIKTKTVYITNELVAGIQDGRQYSKVDRSDIISIRTKRGTVSKHPILQIVISIGMIIFGFIPILGICSVLFRGDMFSTTQFAAALSTPIGAFLLHDAISKKFYFEIAHNIGREKIVLGNLSREEISSIEASAHEKFGYNIISEI
jgi:hypothetical protein